MSETLVGTKADAAPEAESLHALQPEQHLVPSEGGVAEVEAMLDRPADATHAPVLSEREKRWELRKLHKAGLSHDIVAAKDENGKIMMTQGKDGQWRIKTRLDLNAYAKHHRKDANDGYAALARAAGQGKTTSEQLRSVAADARAKMQARRQHEEDTTSAEQKTDWKTRTMAALGGLAVGVAAKVKPAKEAVKAKSSVVRTSMHERIKTLNGHSDDEVTATKEMPAAQSSATVTKEVDNQERPSRRAMIVGGLGVLALTAAALFGASMNGEQAPKEVTASTVETGTPEKPTEETPKHDVVVDMSDMIYSGEVPGETTDAATDISVAARTQALTLGGNIWDSSRAFLEQHDVTASNYNTDVIKDAVLAAEGLSEADATQLPVGYTFTIPADVLDDLK